MAKSNSGVTRFNDYLTFMDNAGTVDAINYVSPLEIEKFDDKFLKRIDKDQADYLDIEKDKDKLAQDSYDTLIKTEDKVLNLPADNPYQAAQLDQLKGDVGINDKLFDINEEDLKNPYAIKGIESKAARLVSDPRFINVQREQALHKQFKDDIDSSVCSGKNANSALCMMARSWQKNYLQDTDGTYSATTLRASDFLPMDVMKEIEGDLKLVPQTEFEANLRKEKGAFILEEWTNRSRDLVKQSFAGRVNDPRFANNLVAYGFDTPEKVNNFINTVADAWSAKSIKKASLHVVPLPGTGGASSGAGAAGVGTNNNLLLGFRDYVASSPLTVAQKTKANAFFSDSKFAAASAWSDKFSPESSSYIRSLLSKMDTDGIIKDDKGVSIDIRQELLNSTAKNGNLYALVDLLGITPSQVKQGIENIEVVQGADGKATIKQSGGSGYSARIVAKLNQLFSQDANGVGAAINKYKNYFAGGYGMEDTPEFKPYWDAARNMGIVGGNAEATTQQVAQTTQPSQPKTQTTTVSKTKGKPKY